MRWQVSGGSKRRERVSQMSCNEPIIEVQNLGKCYNIYKDPKDRLRQAIVPRIHSLFGRKQAHRYYQEFWALKDVSLTVGRG